MAFEYPPEGIREEDLAKGIRLNSSLCAICPHPGKPIVIRLLQRKSLTERFPSRRQGRLFVSAACQSQE
jgi:hypothetical protein